MKGYLLLDKEQLGEVEFEVTDESMGGIGGQLVPYPTYNSIRTQVQHICEAKGIANIQDFPFAIQLANKYTIVPQGGIGITDIKGVDEIYVESAGLGHDLINEVLESQ
jgi:hypothetical protein